MENRRNDGWKEGIKGSLLAPLFILFISLIFFSHLTAITLAYSIEEGFVWSLLLYVSIDFFALYSLILMIQQKRSFLVISTWTIIYIALFAIGFSLLQTNYLSAGLSFLGVVVWISYFQFSERVRKTFVF